MKDLILNFPNQLLESINIANNVEIKVERTITNVVICGLGGSGIGGEIIKQWTKNYAKVPVEVCHSYVLPSYVNKSTLVISCSYSGNTEETLSTLNAAIEKSALIIGVTSGGRLEQILTERNDVCIKVPGGLPPRSALAYPLVQLLEIFEQTGLLSESIKSQLVASVDFLKKEQEEIRTFAATLLFESADKNFLLYGEDTLEPVLLRTCQQINENSKELAFFNVIPEMNHNEIVGWAKEPNNLFVVFVRTNNENTSNTRRLDITRDIIEERTASITEIHGKGSNPIEQALYLIHLFDWLSLMKSERNGVDVVEVNVIDFLKAELEKSKV